MFARGILNPLPFLGAQGKLSTIYPQNGSLKLGQEF